MTPDPTQRTELERLISVCCDDAPSDAEQARLNEMLRQDADGRRFYLQQIDLHARLLQYAGPPTSDGMRPPLDVADGPWEARTAWRPYIITALIATLCSLTAQYLWQRPAMNMQPPSPAAVVGVSANLMSTLPVITVPASAYVATMVSAEGAAWHDRVERRTGMRLGTGWLRLTSGRATVRFDGGAVVTLESPASLKVFSTHSAWLTRGRAMFRGDDATEPFDMQTPYARWIDDAGQYAVVVTNDCEEVHVFAGELIRSSRPGSADVLPFLRLEAGQARRFSKRVDDRGTIVALDSEWLRPEFALVALSRTSGSGGLIAYDSFEDRTLRDWRGAWAVHDPDVTSGLFRRVVGLRRGLGPPDKESSARQLRGRIAVSRLTPAPLPTDVDGAYYFSFLTRADRRSTAGETCDVQLSFRNLQAVDPRHKLATTISWSKSSVTVGWEGGGQQASVPIDFHRTYLVVGKFTLSGKQPDQAFVRLYGDQQTIPPVEPVDWTVVSRPVTSRVNFDLVQWSSTNEHGVTVDELRIGSTWSAVAGAYGLPTVAATSGDE